MQRASPRGLKKAKQIEGIGHVMGHLLKRQKDQLCRGKNMPGQCDLQRETTKRRKEQKRRDSTLVYMDKKLTRASILNN